MTQQSFDACSQLGPPLGGTTAMLLSCYSFVQKPKEGWAAFQQMEEMPSAALQHNQEQIKNPKHGFPFPVPG